MTSPSISGFPWAPVHRHFLQDACKLEALGWAQRGGAKEILPATHEYPAIFLEAQGAETVAQCALARGGGSDKQHVLAWQIGALESLASCESSS